MGDADSLTRLCDCTGAACKPRLELSSTTVDFGPCFVHQAGMAASTARLRALNADTQDISFDIGCA